MIQRFRFGTPIETCAVIEELSVTEGKLPFFDLTYSGETDDAISGLEFIYTLKDKDIVYGLGEQVRGINKRGWIYTSCNADDPHHHEDTKSLYGSHNFLLISGEKLFGVFFDYAGNITFDVGYTHRDTLRITPEDWNLDVYVITGESEKDIVKQFRKLIGRSYIAPKWAFGYGQSRWGYKDAKDIREVAAEYRKREIPLDSIYMDIDYMERYKDFTIDEEAFPAFEAFCAGMMEQGIHLVPIIDAGVKIEEGYDVYEEGVKNDYFCKDTKGKDFVGAVWPGRVHFPDFLKAETRKWFGEKYAFLLEKGVDGFWNDMNEPAIFYTEERLASVMERISELSKENLDVNSYFEFTGLVAGIGNNVGDYETFFHDMGGMKVPHSKVHNLYGYNMTKAAGEAFDRLSPEKRILMFSRSSYIGAHRYGGIWQGDNKSWWSHLLMNLQMMPSLNMAGFLYTGADVGGFGSDTTEDLMLRWLQLAVFTPLMRNHSSRGTREQELYRFDNCDACKRMIEIRYGLIPYLYSEYMKAVLADEMMFRPLSFDFTEDEDARGVEDQLFLGDELMITPVYTQNATGRYVYLPEEMMLVRMRSLMDYETEVLAAGHHYIKAELSELVFFIRKDKAIPLGAAAMNTEKLDVSTLKLLGYDGAEYDLYEDDGFTKKYDIDSCTRKIVS
ncbi:MAG: alpha-glucosidase [Lachnospiraceae bacterium]|nr:alpha-glucosidase [Lachnospiraceae bacterium]